MSKPKVDLDGDEKLRNYGDQTPFLPFGEGEYEADLSAFVYHDGYKGQAYRAKITITKSDRDDVKVGKLFVLQFPLDGKKEQKQAKLKELRQFLAACMSEDPKNEAFKANPAIELLTEATANEQMKTLELGLKISCRDKVARDKDTKEILTNKKGEEVTFTNRYYSPREAA